jgi:hypothetical protein
LRDVCFHKHSHRGPSESGVTWHEPLVPSRFEPKEVAVGSWACGPLLAKSRRDAVVVRGYLG